MPEEDFERQYARSLETYHQEKEAWLKEKTDLLQKIAERDTRIETLEKNLKIIKKNRTMKTYRRLRDVLRADDLRDAATRLRLAIFLLHLFL